LRKLCECFDANGCVACYYEVVVERVQEVLAQLSSIFSGAMLTILCYRVVEDDRGTRTTYPVNLGCWSAAGHEDR
jgi:hypothetical protein